MKFYNRLIAWFLVSIMTLTFLFSFTTVVFAEEGDASERQATFLNYYAKSDGLTLSMQNLTVQDYYVLSVFMSNFYEPGVTTLKELEELSNSTFFDDFSNTLGKSGDAQLKKIVQDIASDTLNGLESGKCTLVNAQGKPISGADFLQAIVKSVNLETGVLKSSKIYFENSNNIAFDFSSPAVKAAFQVIAAYNSELFTNYQGLESIDMLFLDAVGNVWGIEAGEYTEDLKNSLNLRGMISHFGSNKVYLILPACLNPSTFSSNITDQLNLKMPLMNRYVLGCLLDVADFKVNSSSNPSFTEKNIPFYNLFHNENIGNFSRANKGLSVFGLHSLSNYTMNMGKSDGNFGVFNSSWNIDDKKQDLANFIYNPNLISVNKTKTNGIGEFGTNSYIVFSPNLMSVQTGSNQDTTGTGGNRAVDMSTDFLWWNVSKAFTSMGNKGSNIDVSAQQNLLAYLFTPTALTLNQVSMNFFFESSSISQGSENASEEYAKYLYNYSDPSDILASKTGMRGLSLFMSNESNYQDLNDDKYVGMIADNMYQSKFLKYLTTGSSGSLDSVENYKKVKEGKINEINVNDNIKNIYSQILFGNDDNNVFTVSSWGLDTDFFEYKTYNGDDAWNIYVKPRSFANFGNSNKDIAYSRTMSLQDVELQNKVSKLTNNITNKSKADGVVLSYARPGLARNFAIALYGYSIFSPSEAVLNACTINTQLKSGVLFGQSGVNFTSNIHLSKFANQDFVMGIYFGYIIDMMGISSCDESGLTFNGFNSPFLPKYAISADGGEMEFQNNDTMGSGVINSEDLSFEEKQKDLINRIYGLTNDKNNDYRNNLIKNILEGFILTVHRTITGTWYSNIDTVSSGGASTYQSVTGYVYTPTLEELSFTATLMNNYIKIYIICMLIILFLMVLMVLLHHRTWQQGILITIIMSVALLFPYILISNSVNISNKISDGIYSDRFDFWAMSQHQQRTMSLNNTASMDEKDKLLTLSNATADLTYTGDTGVKIKWMSPKKVEMFQNLYSDKSLSDSFVTNMQIFKWLFSSFIYDSEFVDTDTYGSYLYRPYNSIAIEARAYYGWGKSLLDTPEYQNKESNYNYNGITFNNILKPFVTSVEKLNLSDENKNIYLAGLSRIDKDFYTSGSNSLTYSIEKLEDIDLVSQIDYNSVSDIANLIGLWGMLNDQITDRIAEPVETSGIAGVSSNLPSLDDENAFRNKDIRQISKAIYLKNTESPYYYFYSVLRYRYAENSENTLFKTALLDNNLFKVKKEEVSLLNNNKDVTNSYRDFLDLEGLFTYVIPYMHESNKYVKAWQKVNGSEIEQYNFEYGVKEDGMIDDTADGLLEKAQSKDGSAGYREAVEKKNNINRVWNMYCPWVDSLYDLNVYNKKVSVGGKNVYIEDTLNPSSYISQGRPMIFSEADMIIKGYTYKDLTDVEKRIQEVLEKTYTDLLYLVNYYDMDDDVLLSAAAMYATFNFNKEFSQTSFLGNSVMLYPQGFELKNFNYDAFMRLALLNSTGESVFATDDLYSRVLAKTSVFTGLLLLVCDLIACIAIPMFKFIILVGLLFLGILICIACVINPPEKIFEAVNKSLLLPTVLFMALNIGFSWVMSFVVGEGLTAYVGSKGVNFATNDPTITMLIMAFLGMAYLFFAWKILKFLIQAYKNFGMGTALAAVGVIGAAIAAGTAGVAKKAQKAGAFGLGAGVGAVVAGKGNRLGGAVDGAQKGSMNMINSRIREKRAAKDFAEAQGRGNSEITDKLNGLSSETGSGSGGGSGGGSGSDGCSGTKLPDMGQPPLNNSNDDAGVSAPPSELDKGFEKANDKNATFMGRGLSNFVYAKEKVRDNIDGLKHKREKTGMALKNTKMNIKEGARNAAHNVKTAPQRGLNYLNKSVKSAKDDNDYYKLLRSERNDERLADEMAEGKKLAKREREFKETSKPKKRRVDISYEG